MTPGFPREPTGAPRSWPGVRYHTDRPYSYGNRAWSSPRGASAGERSLRPKPVAIDPPLPATGPERLLVVLGALVRELAVWLRTSVCLGLMLGLLVACRRESPHPPPAAPSAASIYTGAASTAEAFPGQSAYQEAKGLIRQRDLRAAIQSLQRAIEANPEFAEAWYQLGAAKANLAIQEVRSDEAAAVQLFREGVEAKKQALHLMRLGKCYVWDAEQRKRAWADVQEALRGVDEVLADRRVTVAALKSYAR